MFYNTLNELSDINWGLVIVKRGMGRGLLVMEGGDRLDLISSSKHKSTNYNTAFNPFTPFDKNGFLRKTVGILQIHLFRNT